MLSHPDTPSHVLLEYYGTRCADLAGQSSHSLTQRVLKQLAVDLLIASEQQRKTSEPDALFRV